MDVGVVLVVMGGQQGLMALPAHVREVVLASDMPCDI